MGGWSTFRTGTLDTGIDDDGVQETIHIKSGNDNASVEPCDHFLRAGRGYIWGSTAA